MARGRAAEAEAGDRRERCEAEDRRCGKRAYSRPRLHVVGSLRDLVQQGGNVLFDGLTATNPQA